MKMKFGFHFFFVTIMKSEHLSVETNRLTYNPADNLTAQLS